MTNHSTVSRLGWALRDVNLSLDQGDGDTAMEHASKASSLLAQIQWITTRLASRFDKTMSRLYQSTK